MGLVHTSAPRLSVGGSPRPVAPDPTVDLVGVDYVPTPVDRSVSAKHGMLKVGHVVDPFRRASYPFEGEGEELFLTFTAARADVDSIRTQLWVAYRDEEGGKAHHYLDALVTWRGGRKVAYAVKDTEKAVAESGVKKVLEAIRDHHGAVVADDYRVVTKEGLDPVGVLNARDILERGLDQDLHGQALVGVLLPRLGPAVTLREVALRSGLGDRGARAATALVQSGVLAIPRGERLHVDLPLENRSERRVRTKR